MDINTPEFRNLVTELSLPIVANVAPNEVPYFDLLAEQYFDDPAPPDIDDAALDIGLVVDLAPAVLAAIGAALPYILPHVLDAVKDISVDAIKEWLKKRREQQKDDFTAEQMQQIEATTRKVLKQWKISEKKTNQVIAEMRRSLVAS
ncbi:MAG: hypothetical protein R3A44_42945 [Caldilineaceae bacterium]